MRRTSILATIAVAALIGGPDATIAGSQKPRAVVELFTSQGCSSCPPADRLAGELARDPGLVVLSMPVDYWDYLGWKDTLASAVWTQRQRAYASQRGDRQVYTPQMVVNGTEHLVGSDRDRIRDATSAASQYLAISLDPSAGGYRVGLPASPGKSGSLLLLKVSHERTVAIGRGENSGASVTYANVVRSISRLGDWSGTAATFDIATSDLKLSEGDGFVVLLQAGSEARPGAILAAAKSPTL